MTPPTPKAAPHDEEAAAVWRDLQGSEDPSWWVQQLSRARISEDFGKPGRSACRHLARAGCFVRDDQDPKLYHRTPLGHRVAAYGRSQTR